MRAFILAGLLTMMLGVTGASAQSSSAYPYCLMTGSAQDCGYTSMQQCLASKRGNADFCEPNNRYTGVPERYRAPQ